MSKPESNVPLQADAYPPTDIETSNSLAHLAALIRSEHEAVATALKESVRHAIAAGELLLEAKDAVQHGLWLPWLRDHCAISERTAQLYMRVAKNRTAIEEQIRNGVADLSLNEAAALLMLSSDVRKLLNFAKQTEGLSGEALLDFCIANNVGVIRTPNYDPLARCSEAEKAEWLVFVLFLSYDGRAGLDPDDAWRHVQYLLQRPFQNVDEWLGPAGDDWRRVWGSSNYRPRDEWRTAWAAFRDARRHLTLADIDAEVRALRDRFHEDKAAGVIQQAKRRRRRA
jgi:Protein of unknown function (DUF3102)